MERAELPEQGCQVGRALVPATARLLLEGIQGAAGCWGRLQHAVVSALKPQILPLYLNVSAAPAALVSWSRGWAGPALPYLGLRKGSRAASLLLPGHSPPGTAAKREFQLYKEISAKRICRLLPWEGSHHPSSTFDIKPTKKTSK